MHFGVGTSERPVVGEPGENGGDDVRPAHIERRPEYGHEIVLLARHQLEGVHLLGAVEVPEGIAAEGARPAGHPVAHEVDLARLDEDDVSEFAHRFEHPVPQDSGRRVFRDRHERLVDEGIEIVEDAVRP